MKAGRYATTRQKSCQHCSIAKAKCDRKAGSCSRCTQRGLSCTYPLVRPAGGSAHGRADPSAALSIADSRPSQAESRRRGREGQLTETPITGGQSIRSIDENSPGNSSWTTITGAHVSTDPSLTATGPLSGGFEALDFSNLELFCPINADEISNRWLNSYVPVPGQEAKEYPPSILAFIYRILKSYAAVTARGRGVPQFVHASQIMAGSTRSPLATCLTLVRMCEKPLPGSESVAAEVLQREMNNLYDQHRTYDDMTLLAAFQAYLLYSMVLFFSLSQYHNPFLRQAMMNLQGLASSSSRRGLMCISEQQRARPKWEAWIVTETKRRTLFAMYLFDSVLSAQDGLPSFLGTELLGLPAPANHVLWSSRTRHEWEAAYNVHLTDWPDGALHIDELWPIPVDFDEAGLLERRRRVDLWLENVDEFGTVLYAVTSCTHGG